MLTFSVTLLHLGSCFIYIPGTWLFGSSSPSPNIPRADVEPIIRPDLLPSMMVNPSKLEVLYTFSVNYKIKEKVI